MVEVIHKNEGLLNTNSYPEFTLYATGSPAASITCVCVYQLVSPRLYPSPRVLVPYFTDVGRTISLLSECLSCGRVCSGGGVTRYRSPWRTVITALP